MRRRRATYSTSSVRRSWKSPLHPAVSSVASSLSFDGASASSAGAGAAFVVVAVITPAPISASAAWSAASPGLDRLGGRMSPSPVSLTLPRVSRRLTVLAAWWRSSPSALSSPWGLASLGTALRASRCFPRPSGAIPPPPLPRPLRLLQRMSVCSPLLRPEPLAELRGSAPGGLPPLFRTLPLRPWTTPPSVAAAFPCLRFNLRKGWAPPPLSNESSLSDCYFSAWASFPGCF